MHLSAEIRYPDADPGRVFAMLTDRAFQERKCAETGSLAYEVEITPTPDGGARIATTRTLPTDQVPEFVRRFVGGEVRVREHVLWGPADGAAERSGTVEVEIGGAPVRLAAQVRLAGVGDDVVETIDGELKASVPLIGGKIEKSAEPAIRAAIRVEEHTGRDWLAR